MKFGYVWLLSGVLLTSSLSADPWGRDADLVDHRLPPQVSRHTKKNSPLISVSDLLIAFHQKVVSPADGPRSHFKPSSSEYTKQAIRKHGFFWGYLMGCDRLMRENNEEWIYSTIVGEYNTLLKHDPIP